MSINSISFIKTRKTLWVPDSAAKELYFGTKLVSVACFARKRHGFKEDTSLKKKMKKIQEEGVATGHKRMSPWPSQIDRAKSGWSHHIRGRS